jgi:hypothetical protein
MMITSKDRNVKDIHKINWIFLMNFSVFYLFEILLIWKISN